MARQRGEPLLVSEVPELLQLPVPLGELCSLSFYGVDAKLVGTLELYRLGRETKLLSYLLGEVRSYLSGGDHVKLLVARCCNYE